MSKATMESSFFVPYASPGAIVAASVALPVIGIIAVLLRLFARSTRKQRLGVDDWLIFPALVRY